MPAISSRNPPGSLPCPCGHRAVVVTSFHDSDDLDPPVGLDAHRRFDSTVFGRRPLCLSVVSVFVSECRRACGTGFGGEVGVSLCVGITKTVAFPGLSAACQSPSSGCVGERRSYMEVRGRCAAARLLNVVEHARGPRWCRNQPRSSRRVCDCNVCGEHMCN